MAKLWNLEQLRDHVKFLVGYNEGQSDQDFDGPSTDTNKWFDRFISMAYYELVEEIEMESDSAWLYTVSTEVWPSGAVTYELPDSVKGKTIKAVYDITSSATGTPLPIGLRGGSTIYFKDHDTLQWGTAGPGSDKTLEFVHGGEYKEMIADTDTPDLIPRQHRHIVAWGAACWLRLIGDEKVPAEWQKKYEDLKLTMLTNMSKGRGGSPPVIRNTSGSTGVGEDPYTDIYNPPGAGGIGP